MEHRRLLIATILFIIFLVVWQTFILKPPQKRPSQTPTAEVRDTVQKTSKEGEIKTARLELDSLKAHPIVVKTPLYTAKFSKTGVLIDYYIPKYDVHLVPEGGFAFITSLDSLIVPPEIETLYVSETDVSLGFMGITPDSAETLVKSFEFDPNSYLIEYAGPQDLSVTSLKLTEKNIKDELRYTGLVYYSTRYRKIPLKKLKQGFQLDGEDLLWAGFRTKYFMLAIVPSENSVIDDISTQELDDKLVKLDFSFRVPNPKAKIYLGPIDYYKLKEVGYGLWKAYDFGPSLVRPFSRIILSIMTFLHKHIHNYGWVIVIFAVLMKILFSPLNLKNLKNMQKMRELQPQIEVIKKRYKNDPEKMQKEMMELYRKHGFNPFSGCFVLLLQLPIFWAMYQILRTNIELRGAPWILWIRDLSSKDPYFVLPILMGITSMAQSLMQPMQDQQSKVMAITMPLIFTFIFLTFPSGIVLYWLTFNLLGIAEQMILRRWKQ